MAPGPEFTLSDDSIIEFAIRENDDGKPNIAMITTFHVVEDSGCNFDNRPHQS